MHTVAGLVLRPLADADEPVVRRAQQELLADDFVFALGLGPEISWSAYLDRLARTRAGADLAADRVPATFLVAEVRGEIVGRTSIRHELNDGLLVHGGHIGYGVRPAFRRLGHATEILRQSLVIARSHGVHDALLTCDDGNAGSAAAIEACGGRRDDAWPTSEFEGHVVRRYWIPLP